MIIGAEIRKVERQYSPYGIALTSSEDFITCDTKIIELYNTDVICEIGNDQIPVYSNLADIPLYLPDGLTIKVTDEAYPEKARWVNSNFRLDYSYGVGALGTTNKHCCGGSIESVGFWGFIMILVAVVVTGIVVAAVIGAFQAAILAWRLPGGVSGAEREIDDTHKLITFPDGSWVLWDTETGEGVMEGEKPSDWVMSFVIPIILAIAGVAGIILFIKYGAPALSKAFVKAKPMLKPG